MDSLNEYSNLMHRAGSFDKLTTNGEAKPCPFVVSLSNHVWGSKDTEQL